MSPADPRRKTYDIIDCPRIPFATDGGALMPAPTLIVTDRAGAERAVDGEDGLSVMEVIRGGGFDELLASCGGNCSCATCHVYVDPAFAEALPPIATDEDDVLDSSSHRRANSRLSCQIRFGDPLSGLRVQIAPED